MRLKFFNGYFLMSPISCWGWRTSGEQIPAWWGCLFGAPSSDTFLCWLQSSFNTSNHSRWKQLGPGEILLEGKCCLSPCFICMFHKHRVWSQGLICKSIPICITLCCLHSCLELPPGLSWWGCYSISFAFAWDINTVTFSDIAYCTGHICFFRLFEFHLGLMVTCLLYRSSPWMLPWVSCHYTDFRWCHLATCHSTERNQSMSVHCPNVRLFHCSPVWRDLASHPLSFVTILLHFLMLCFFLVCILQQIICCCIRLP